MNQIENQVSERERKLSNLANYTSKELLRLKPNEAELILFFKRLQVVDASIKYAK